MARFDLSQLFDPKFDIIPPRLVPAASGYVRVIWLNGKKVVRIPLKMSGKLAYLLGVVIGDGYVTKPSKRKSHGSGFYWKIVITGPHDYLVEVKNLFSELFRTSGGLFKDDRKGDTWQLRLASVVLHRFFTRVLGLPQDRKTTCAPWSRFDLVKDYPIYFLAGLIHSDGYVGKNYIGIVQRQFRFLARVKRFANETLRFQFRGPKVNRRIGGKTVGWIISIYRREERLRLLQAINGLEIGTMKRTAK